MRRTYQAFASMDGVTWCVLWKGNPGDSETLVRRLALMRLAYFDVAPEKLAQLRATLCVCSRSLAWAIPPLRKALDAYLPRPRESAMRRVYADLQREYVEAQRKVIRGPWPERNPSA